MSNQQSQDLEHSFRGVANEGPKLNVRISSVPHPRGGELASGEFALDVRSGSGSAPSVMSPIAGDELAAIAHQFTHYVQARWETHFAAHQLYIQKVLITDSAYAEILDLRQQAYGFPSTAEPCHVDTYSDLWLLSSSSGPIGTIRGTHAARGRMDCEEQFPPLFRHSFENITASASRFCLKPRLPHHLQAARILAEYAWAESLDCGIRCDVIDVNERAIPHYRRMGYQLIRGNVFEHPLLHTQSRVMVAVADSQFRGRLSHLLATPMPSDLTSQLLENLAGIIE